MYYMQINMNTPERRIIAVPSTVHDAPISKRVRRRLIFDTTNDYVKVHFIETKMYRSGHVEKNMSARVYERRPDIAYGGVMTNAVVCDHLSKPILDDLDSAGYVMDYEENRGNIVFHQVVLIKQHH